jgi:signal transduction histidine kinase
LEERSQIISERNEQLSLKNQELEHLNREKNEFLGIVAHDLKNPLSGILGLAELLAEASETPDSASTLELQECVAMIQGSANNMFQLITNLLDVNAIESGKINVLLEPTDLSSLVRRVIRNYIERATRKNISVHFEVVPMTTYLVLTDVQISQQILDNLVSNAVKYSPHGKNIHVRLINDEHWVKCEIRDEGQGLTVEEQQKLFCKFTRLSAKPTGDEHSTGLGLFIVKKLVDAIHAKVYCHSEVGQGACFVVEFPKLRH